MNSTFPVGSVVTNKRDGKVVHIVWAAVPHALLRTVTRPLIGRVVAPCAGLPAEYQSLPGRCCQADSKPEHAHVAQNQIRQTARDRQ